MSRAVRRTALLCAVVLATGVALAPSATAEVVPAAAVWNQVYELTGSQTTLSQVASTGPENVWAAGTTTGSDGYARPAAYHTEGGATTTTLLNLDWTSQWGRFIGIDGVADDDMWATGIVLQKATGTTRPLLAHWDGTQWTQVALPGGPAPLGELVGVAARSADDVWFAGTFEGVSTARLFHWNGTAVRNVPVRTKDPLCSPARATVTALTVTAQDVWLGLRCGLTTDGRQEGSVQRLTNGMWRLAVALPPDSGILGLAENGAGIVVAVGTRSAGSTYESVVYAGATTMSLLGAFGGDQLYWSVAARGQRVYLVGQIGINNTPLVLRRGANGWFPEPVDGGQPLFDVVIDSAGTAFAVGPTFGGSFGTPSAGLWRRTA